MNKDKISQNQITPPIAKQQPQVLELHGDRRVDNYFWMRDLDNPKVVEYLEAENSYTKAMMQHTEELQRQGWQAILESFKRYVEGR